MDIHQVTSSAVSHASEIPPGSSDPLVVYGIAGTGSLIAGRSPSLKKGGGCPNCGGSGFDCCKKSSDQTSISETAYSLYGEEINRNHPALERKSNDGKEEDQLHSKKSGLTQNSQELDEDEKKKVEELKKRDREVRAHEQAHLAAAGSLATGGANFEYEKGPDGASYAVGGHVSISFGGDSPEEKLQQAEQAARAALAPAKPSTQDQRVAAEARQEAQKARQEISEKRSSGNSSEKGTEKAGVVSGTVPATWNPGGEENERNHRDGTTAKKSSFIASRDGILSGVNGGRSNEPDSVLQNGLAGQENNDSNFKAKDHSESGPSIDSGPKKLDSTPLMNQLFNTYRSFSSLHTAF